MRTFAIIVAVGALYFVGCDLGEKTPVEDVVALDTLTDVVPVDQNDHDSNTTPPEDGTGTEVPVEDVVPQPNDAVLPDQNIEPDCACVDIQPPQDLVPDLEPGVCGDGVCSWDEDPCSCADDCLLYGETCCEQLDCPQPKCGPCCVVPCENHLCGQETWLENCCWNGVCDEGESFETCPEDCPELTPCEQNGGTCAMWTPTYDQCPDGTFPVADMCESKSEVCCRVPGPDDCQDLLWCNQDSDCVMTNLDCCGCQSGGLSFAINTMCEQVWQDGMDCEGIACLAVYNCGDEEPACVNGQCALVSPL